MAMVNTKDMTIDGELVELDYVNITSSIRTLVNDRDTALTENK